MYDDTRSSSTYTRLLNNVALALTLALAVLMLTLAFQVGSRLAALLEPEDAVAAPEYTPTAQVPSTDVPPATATATPVPNTPVPPTATLTPAPTSTPVPPTPVLPTPRIVAGPTGVNVRTGPGTGYDRIGFLEPATEVPVTGRMDDWYRIHYEGDTGYVFGELVTPFDTAEVPDVTWDELPKPVIGSPVFTPAPVWAIDEPRWIDVDLSEQRVTAYEGRTPVKSYLVSTGLPGTPTPEGQFRIWIKFRYDDMEGADYYLQDVPWVMYLYRGL